MADRTPWPPPAPVLPHWAVDHGRLIWHSGPIPGIDRTRWPAIIVHLPHSHLVQAKVELADRVVKSYRLDQARAAYLAADWEALERALDIPTEPPAAGADDHLPGDQGRPVYTPGLGNLLAGGRRHNYQGAHDGQGGCLECGDPDRDAPQHLGGRP